MVKKNNKTSPMLGRRKGQLKIQQMAFMLIAVTIFFSLILLFYVSMKTANLREDVLDSRREKAVGLVTKIAATPEFTFEGVSRAVDADKLMVLRNSKKYENFWGVKGIVIRKLYPPSENVECTTGNYPNCNVIKLFTNKNVADVASYVSLCRKDTISGSSYNRCELALLMIEIDEVLE
ncbi:hypothetical protein CMI46_00865 [Candidatus Pacearchaeota archaeon]|nr:hypothetical protein [Candidatus Pacearchaeota archaeon]